MINSEVLKSLAFKQSITIKGRYENLQTYLEGKNKDKDSNTIYSDNNGVPIKNISAEEEAELKKFVKEFALEERISHLSKCREDLKNFSLQKESLPTVESLLTERKENINYKNFKPRIKNEGINKRLSTVIEWTNQMEDELTNYLKTLKENIKS